MSNSEDIHSIIHSKRGKIKTVPKNADDEYEMICEKNHTFKLYEQDLLFDEWCPHCSSGGNKISDLLGRLKIDHISLPNGNIKFNFKGTEYLIGNNLIPTTDNTHVISLSSASEASDKDIWLAIKNKQKFFQIGEIATPAKTVRRDTDQQYNRLNLLEDYGGKGKSLRRYTDNVPPEAKICIGYVRVSTEEQANTGHSLDAQITSICKYADFKGLFLKAMYEEGISAKTLEDRPAASSMIENIRQGEYLVVTKTDRLARDLIDLLKIKVLIEKKKAFIVFLDFDLDTSTPMGKAALAMQGAFAQAEREQISERVKTTMRDMRAKGTLITKPPFGWKKSAIKGQPHEKDPEQQKAIEYIRRLKTENPDITIAAICTLLDRSNFKPGTKGTAAKWHHATVKNIMRQNSIIFE